MRHLKPLLTFALCLVVLATSVTQAIARGQMAGGQMVQLCASGEAVTVMMDAQGNPVDPARHCPDCLALTAALPPATPEIARALGRTALLPPTIFARPTARVVLSAYARGPPVLI